MPADDTVELRLMAKRLTVDVIDAFSGVRRIPRGEMVNRILDQWASGKLHEMNVLANVTRGNPAVPEQTWSDTEV